MKDQQTTTHAKKHQQYQHPTLLQASAACSRAPARTAVAAGRRDGDADASVLREAAVAGFQQARARQADCAVGRPRSAARARLRAEQAQAAQRQLLPAQWGRVINTLSHILTLPTLVVQALVCGGHT